MLNEVDEFLFGGNSSDAQNYFAISGFVGSLLVLMNLEKMNYDCSVKKDKLFSQTEIKQLSDFMFCNGLDLQDITSIFGLYAPQCKCISINDITNTPNCNPNGINNDQISGNCPPLLVYAP